MADDPEDDKLRRQEVKLKLQLKSWEKSFELVNGRKPNRNDIKRAGTDVKEMYKRYWFYKANPGQEYIDKNNESKKKKKELIPKQSTSGLAFFEDSIVVEKTKAKGKPEEGDPIMKSLMMSFKSNKKSFTKKDSNKNKPKKVPVLEVVPESPGKEDNQENSTGMEMDTSDIRTTNTCYTDSNTVSRNEFLHNIFHGDGENESFRKEEAVEVETDKDKKKRLDSIFEGCTLLPVDFKPKRAAKRRVTSKKKSAENFIRLDMKHKSFASKGYKKFNVQKYKRKMHRKLRRDKCFCCGESGHWANECTMKLSNKSGPVDEDGIPVLNEDQIIIDEGSEDLVVKAPTVVYSSNNNASLSEVKSNLAPVVPQISKSERLFMTILNDGKDTVQKFAISHPQINPNFVGSSYGSSGESIKEASNENESRDSLQYNLFDEDDMMEEFLGKERIDDILAAID